MIPARTIPPSCRSAAAGVAPAAAPSFCGGLMLALLALHRSIMASGAIAKLRESLPEDFPAPGFDHFATLEDLGLAFRGSQRLRLSPVGTREADAIIRMVFE